MGGPTTITVPAYVSAVPEMESTPERAETFATNLRAVTVAVKNAQSLASGYAESGWQGDAKDAHDHAATRFVARLDTVDAALDVAVTAADRYEERLSKLQLRRGGLVSRVARLNNDIANFVPTVQGVTSDSDVDALRTAAAALEARATRLERDIAAWVGDCHDADDDFVAALQGVDTVAEGRTAASAPGRPDVTALRRKLAGLSGDPTAVAAWWAGLTRAQKEALTTDDPALVGNTDGIPTRDRDEANRASVYSDIDYLSQRERDGEITDDERNALTNAKKVREQLDKYRDQVDPLDGRELAYVMVYKPHSYTGDGGVAMALGDPDLAKNVAAFVPGFNTTTSSLNSNLDHMNDLRNTDPTGQTSTIFWLDYDAPNFSGSVTGVLDGLQVATPVEAMIGGHRFAGFISGLHATDEGPAAHLTAIGHSYGSTTLGHALLDGARVDDTVLIGSPGQPVPNAHLFPHAGHVWVGSMDHDPVTLLGATFTPRPDAITDLTETLGYDPAQMTFGGTRFETGDGSLRLGDLLHNHSSYFQGESLDNMGHIVTGDDDAVTTRDHRHGYDYMTLPELLGTAAADSGLHKLEDAGVGVVHGAEWLGSKLNPFD